MDPKIPNPTEDKRAGYLIVRLKPGEGVLINNEIEVRVAEKSIAPEVQLAIRAPKHLPIRRVT